MWSVVLKAKWSLVTGSFTWKYEQKSSRKCNPKSGLWWTQFIYVEIGIGEFRKINVVGKEGCFGECCVEICRE